MTPTVEKQFIKDTFAKTRRHCFYEKFESTIFIQNGCDD